MAGGGHRIRARAQPAGRRQPARGVRRDRRGARAHLLRRHHDPPFLIHSCPGKRKTMTITQSRPAIAATGLRKSFGDQVVLDGLDLNVQRGTVFALLGANGAGKTTTVKILSTLISADLTSADAGSVQVAGYDLAREPDAVRAAIGVTGQFS